MHPKNPKYIIEGNDGGLNISRDGGQTWRFVENLPIAQFYHINYDNEMPYNVYGGMQDNGSWKGPAYVWRQGGIRNSYWQEIYFGDGFDVVRDPSDNRYVYAMSQEGYVGRVDTETGYSKLIRPVHPEGKPLRFNWNAAIAQDPFDENTLYFGAQYVFKSENQGETWRVISPDLTTNDTSKQTFLESGGLTYDVTGAENYTTILAIEPDPNERGTMWVGTDDGRVQITRDGGENWTDVYGNLKGARSGMWVPQIVASPHRAGAAFVVLNDYRRNHWDSYLYYTDDYGKTFRRLASPEKVWGYAMSVAQDFEEENLLFLGTNNGLYFSWNFGENWQKWGDDFPTVPVADLKIHPRENDLIVGTFGRSAWVLDDLAPLRAFAKNEPQLIDNENNVDTNQRLWVAPIRDAYQVKMRRADGTRFAADAIFQGDNRGTGALITYWNGYSEADSLKQKKAKIFIKKDGEIIRTLKRDFKEGFNRFYWNLDQKSVQFPSRKEDENDTTESGGLSVLPDDYWVVVSLGGERDSAQVTVKTDPRIDLDESALRSNFEYKKRLFDKVEILAKAVKQIKRSRKTLDLLKNLIKNEEKDSVKDIRDSIKTISKKLDKFEDRFFGKDVEGYFSEPEVLRQQYGLLRYYLFSNLGEITESSEVLAEKFLKDAQVFLDDLNGFYREDWAEFEGFVREKDLSLFGEVEEYRLE